MKKNYSVFGVLLMSLALNFTACENPNGNNNNSNNQDPDQPTNVDAMTSDEQKKYLMDVGKSVLNTFNTNDQKSAVELVDGMIYKLESYSWNYDAFEEYASKDIEALFALPKYVSQVASGRQTPMAPPVFNFGFSNYAAVFEANETTKTWEQKQNESGNTGVIVRAKSNRNSPLEAKCWGEGKVSTYSYTYYVGEQSQERYASINKFKYVGGSYQYDQNYGYERYILQGDYDYDYTSAYGGYKYVGPNQGNYAIDYDAVTYVFVGEGHGAYNYNYNPTSYDSEDDWYTFVGDGNGKYARKTVFDAVYKMYGYSSSPDYYGPLCNQVTDNSGNYIKYYRYSTVIKDRTFAGAEERTIRVELPEKIRFTLKEGTTTIVDITQTYDLVENDHYNLSGSYTITNMSWAMALQASHKSAYATAEMKYGQTSLFSAKVNLPSFDMYKKRGNETYVEYGERIGDHWDEILNEVGEITGEVDIMNKVQIKAKVSDMGSLFNAYMDWRDQYDSETLSGARELCNVYSKYCAVGIYYGTNTLQAKMLLDPYSYERRVYDYSSYPPSYSNKVCYDVEPIICFVKDDTKYAYDAYFTENRFGSLITLTEDVMNNYLGLLSFHPQTPVDLH